MAKIGLIPDSNRNNIIDSLIVLSKYCNCYEAFKARLKNSGVKKHRQNGIESFLRILEASDSDILDWYEKVLLH